MKKIYKRDLEVRLKIGRTMKGHEVSEETRNKIRLSNTGKTMKDETKFKISKSKEGCKSWNKGKIGVYSKETLRKMSLAKLGKLHLNNKKAIKNCIICNKEFRTHPSDVYHVCCSKRCRTIKRSNSLKNNKRSWRGGNTPLNQLLRNSSMYKIWRELVFLRDNFTCQNVNCSYCQNKQGIIIHPHHIKSFVEYPELRFVLSNGITYCKEYHLESGLHKKFKNEVIIKNVI